MAAVAMWPIWIVAYVTGMSSQALMPRSAQAAEILGSAMDRQLATAVLWAAPAICLAPVVCYILISWLGERDPQDDRQPELADLGLPHPGFPPAAGVIAALAELGNGGMSGGPDDALDVLYVDSDPADVLMFQESIVQAGAPVRLHIASDGNQALRFVRRAGAFRSAPRPGPILLELDLADVPGLGVLAELKSDPDLMTIPVIIFSSSCDPAHVRRSYALHADAYIAKPGDFDGFAEAVQQLLGSYISLIRAPPGALGR